MLVAHIFKDIFHAIDECLAQLVALGSLHLPVHLDGLGLAVDVYRSVRYARLVPTNRYSSHSLLVAACQIELEGEITLFVQSVQAGLLLFCIAPQSREEGLAALFEGDARQFPSLVVEDGHDIIFLVAGADCKHQAAYKQKMADISDLSIHYRCVGKFFYLMPLRLSRASMVGS